MRKIVCDKKDAYLLTDRTTRRYFTNIDLHEGVLVILKDKTFYFADARYFSLLKDKLCGTDIIPKLYSGLESLKEIIKSQKIKNLYIDFSIATVQDFNEYKKLKVKVLDGKNEIEKAISIKSKEELNSIKKACEIAQSAVSETFLEIKKGMTELEVKDLLVKKMISMGASGESFDTIVAFGKNSAVPHHETGEKKLLDDEAVLIDTGCLVDGYSSDITRTAFFGKPSQKFLECYEAVKTANELCEEQIISNISTIDADKIAREYLKGKGLDKFFTHSLGHGIGQNIHEYPYLSPKRQGKLYDGMVFSIEPGVYFDGEFGIRIEDTVTLDNGKVIRLFTDSKELNYIK